MYFPYLRGRQNEMLCIRELLESGNLSEKVIPVIEPVRFTSTFFSTIRAFEDRERQIIVIRNPKVGSFEKEFREVPEKIAKEEDEGKKQNLQQTLAEYRTLLNSSCIIDAYICDDEVVEKILTGELNAKEIVLINQRKEDCSYYEDYGEKLLAKYTFIPRNEEFEDEVNGATVAFEDGFNKAKRNLDYIHNPDELFSANHLVYKKRGYEGFSDYSIVGKAFEESGFAPTALAIHIMYFGHKDKLWVHHFVSNSNENYNNPAQKFAEAMDKLVDWEEYAQLPKTKGLLSLVDCYMSGKFPGLGMIKRYSLMHHIQMIGDYLEGK